MFPHLFVPDETGEILVVIPLAANPARDDRRMNHESPSFVENSLRRDPLPPGERFPFHRRNEGVRGKAIRLKFNLFDRVVHQVVEERVRTIPTQVANNMRQLVK